MHHHWKYCQRRSYYRFLLLLVIAVSILHVLLIITTTTTTNSSNNNTHNTKTDRSPWLVSGFAPPSLLSLGRRRDIGSVQNLVPRDCQGWTAATATAAPTPTPIAQQQQKLLPRIAVTATYSSPCPSSSFSMKNKSSSPQIIEHHPTITTTMTITTAATAAIPAITTPLQQRLYENFNILPCTTVLVNDDTDNDNDTDNNGKTNDCDAYCYTVSSNNKLAAAAAAAAHNDDTTTDNDGTTRTMYVDVEIKTLVWEVLAKLTTTRTNNTLDDTTTTNNNSNTNTHKYEKDHTFYIVTASMIHDRIHPTKLKALIVANYEDGQHPTNGDSPRNRNGNIRTISIKSLQLAPLRIAEQLTGYKSGCMPPICHDHHHTKQDNKDTNMDTNNNNNNHDSATIRSIDNTMNMQLYLDASIVDVGVGVGHQHHKNNKNDGSMLSSSLVSKPLVIMASIGSGIIGKSLKILHHDFLRAAGVPTTATSNSNSNSNSNSREDDKNNNSDSNNLLLPVIGSFIATDTDTNTDTKIETCPGAFSSSTTASSIEERTSSLLHSNNNDDYNKDVASSFELKMMSSMEENIRRKQQQQQQSNGSNNENNNNKNDCSISPLPSQRHQRDQKKDRLKEYRSFGTNDIGSKAKLFRTTARKKGRVYEMEQLIMESIRVGDYPKLFPTDATNNHSIDKNALHICAWRGDYDSVVRLIQVSEELYPTLNVVNIISKGPRNYGKTPIFYALTQCRDDVVRYLISEKVNANVLIVNNKGQTPCSIAVSHMQESTIQLLQQKEKEQLLNGGTFCNYRDTHSDQRLYGDLDPRFPIDEWNRKKKKETRTQGTKNDRVHGYDDVNYYEDDDDDHELIEQMKEYQKSIALVPEETIVGGIPTEFYPRSLRQTLRWWNQTTTTTDQQQSEYCHGNNTNSNSNSNSNSDKNNNPQGITSPQLLTVVDTDRQHVMKRLSKDDIESIEPISIEDVLTSSSNSSSSFSRTVEKCTDASESMANTFLIDDLQSIRSLEDEVNNCISKTSQKHTNSCNTNDDDDDKDGTGIDYGDADLSNYAWGLDCEWNPYNDDSPVAILQLATKTKAFLIDVQSLCCKNAKNEDAVDDKAIVTVEKLNGVLMKLFRDPKLSLVGYCIGQDLGKLAASFPHMECFAEFFSVIDLQSVASVYNNSSKKPRGQRTPVMSSLQLMTAALLTKRLDKTQQVSDWSYRPLSQQQIDYAMLDAAILPLLLHTFLRDVANNHDSNDISTDYECNDDFFRNHNSLRSNIRYTECEEGMDYEVSFGKIKTRRGKAWARQSWPTSSSTTNTKFNAPNVPDLPKIIPARQLTSSRNNDSTILSMMRVTNKKRAHLKKIGNRINGEKPKARQLNTILANIDTLPLPGTELGYTKESCVFRAIGDIYLESIEPDTHIGFNRRAGVVNTSNAWILFCNFASSNNVGNAISTGDSSIANSTETATFTENGRLLSFRVKANTNSSKSKKKKNLSSENCLYEHVAKLFTSTNTSLKINDIHDKIEDTKKVLLFARESKRTKYMYLGVCTCSDLTTVAFNSATIILNLLNYDDLLANHASSTDNTFTFQDLVSCNNNNNQNKAVLCQN